MAIRLPASDTTLRELQRFHESLDREKKFDRDMIANTAYLAEEVGEVVSAIRQLNRVHEDAERDQAKGHLGAELSDCLAYILKLANYAEIDLQDAYLRKMQKNLGRDWNADCKKQKCSSVGGLTD